VLSHLSLRLRMARSCDVRMALRRLASMFGAILRLSVLVSLVWIIGDALDGGSQSLLPPLWRAFWRQVMRRPRSISNNPCV
jgi:hypothetical protein